MDDYGHDGGCSGGLGRLGFGAVRGRKGAGECSSGYRELERGAAAAALYRRGA